MINLYRVLEKPRVPDAFIEEIAEHQGGGVPVSVADVIAIAQDLVDARAALRERMKVWWLTPIAAIVLVVNIIVLFAGCARASDPEVERALDQLQATYRANCVQRMEPQMMTACTNAMRTLSSYGRLP